MSAHASEALRLSGRDAVAVILEQFGDVLGNAPKRAALATSLGALIAERAVAGDVGGRRHAEDVFAYMLAGAGDEARARAARTAARMIWGAAEALAAVVRNGVAGAIATAVGSLGDRE